MKDYVIPILLILLIVLVPDKVNAPHLYAFDQRQNEGDIAFFINDYEVVENIDDVKDDCECGGTGQIRTGDGRVFPCPCGPNCKCKKKAGQSLVLSDEIPYGDYYYVKLTASWCGPCKAWDKNERSKLESVGLDVMDIDVDQNPQVMKDFGVKTIPSFVLCRKSDKKAFKKVNGENIVRGNVSGETLLKDVEKLHKVLNPEKVSSISPRYSLQELDAIVRSSYNRNTQLTKAVMGDNSDVYSHLYNDHGFTKEQVMGLEYWVALALHDATHEPASITPWRN